MTFFNRKGVLYVRINGRRISTKMQDTLKNRKFAMSYYKNDEFFKKFDLDVKSVPTVVQLCEEVLRDKESYLKPTSYRTYLSLFTSRIIPYFKERLVTDIKPKDIDYWYSTFDDGQTLTTCLALVKPAFQKAIINEFIETTPLIVDKPKFTSTYEINPFTLDELNKILSYEENEFIKNFVAVSVFTGLRTGELLALEWSDIDYLKMTINVNKSFTLGFKTNGKSKSSRAVIDLPIEALPYFRSQQLKTGLKKEQVFLSRFQNPMKFSSCLNYQLGKMLSSLNIADRSIYQTRHTFASLKLSYGERLEWVSFMLRHKNPSITLTKYYKYLPREKEDRVILDVTHNRHTHSASS